MRVGGEIQTELSTFLHPFGSLRSRNINLGLANRGAEESDSRDRTWNFVGRTYRQQPNDVGAWMRFSNIPEKLPSTKGKRDMYRIDGYVLEVEKVVRGKLYCRCIRQR